MSFTVIGAWFAKYKRKNRYILIFPFVTRMFLSLTCAALYWFFYQYYHVYHTRPIGKYEAALVKWLSVVLLAETLDAPMSMFIFWFYSIGDIVILWNQHLAVLFFMIGHLIFLAMHIPMHNFFVMLGAFGLSSTFFSAYLYQNKLTIDLKEMFLYFSYMLILGYLLVSTIYHEYYGFILFVLSDIGIGFQIKNLYLLEFPLYYTSLLYFTYYL